ncbi:MmcQ/YjbR family DNA-binding protein [Polyangium aurulentum]|uniref:MmcQ/YjbR family DNA-binding protein n=1 Tax=Polyangium aurulentum TaxID=2567896 RepID=UPI0010ADF999|nr:MmcQ/YjbR family DNA-binding protein [Polyangium aurulentum]UQA62811.1 MmcQ/YjbR family DNA-binding protein [Polyangium aurulentum]
MSNATTKPRRSAQESAFERIRTVCLALPDVAEVTKHSRPCFAVRDKTFVMFMDDHHRDGRLAIWCKATPDAQAMVVESDPERFFVPPYVGHRGWIGARLDRQPDWGAISAIVEEAYRLSAPRSTRKSAPRAQRM